MTLVWRLIRTELRKHTGSLGVRFLLVAVVAASPYSFSFLGKWAVDEALQVSGPPKAAVEAQVKAAGAVASPVAVEWKAKTPDQKLRLLGIFFAASIGIHLLVTALSVLSEFLNARVVQHMVCDLRQGLHDKLQRLDAAAFGREQVGQLMTRVLDDTAGIPGNLNNLVVNLTTQVAMLILGVVLLVRLNPRMTLFAVAALPLYAVVCALLLPRIKTNTEDIRGRGAAFSGWVMERLTNVLTVKNYAQEDRENAMFGNILDENQDLARRQHKLNLVFNTLTTLITAGATLTVLTFGFLNIKWGKMSLGEVLAFHQVTAQLFVPISAIVGMVAVIQTLQILAGRVYSVMDAPELLVNVPEPVDPSQVRGEIAFANVSLQYTEGGPFAVRDLSFTIPAGATACLVGPTGCGKSTVISVLTRLYDPTEGTIRIDGLDIREMRVRKLRRAVGNVLHDCQVFTGTLAENIAFGAPDAPRAEIEEAARIAGLDAFAKELPKGLDTRIGRGGVALEKPELAKLALARAVVTEPRIVTVDDTYAALDDETEVQVRRAVREALADRTFLIATSRLSICEGADVVLVMQRGGIVQTGTHEELLACPGVYRRTYMRQMGLESGPDERPG